jgi:hypothetical protein
VLIWCKIDNEMMKSKTDMIKAKNYKDDEIDFPDFDTSDPSPDANEMDLGLSSL